MRPDPSCVTPAALTRSETVTVTATVRAHDTPQLPTSSRSLSYEIDTVYQFRRFIVGGKRLEF